MNLSKLFLFIFLIICTQCSAQFDEYTIRLGYGYYNFLEGEISRRSRIGDLAFLPYPGEIQLETNLNDKIKLGLNASYIWIYHGLRPGGVDREIGDIYRRAYGMVGINLSREIQIISNLNFQGIISARYKFGQSHHFFGYSQGGSFSEIKIRVIGQRDVGLGIGIRLEYFFLKKFSASFQADYSKFFGTSKEQIYRTVLTIGYSFPSKE